MRGLFTIFLLELRSLVRSRALPLLAAVAALWMVAAPYLFRTDGTDAGARELCVRYALGGVTAMLAVVLTIIAAGSIARERAARRLQLTVVRPVSAFAIVLGKFMAIVLAGALVLGLSAAIELARQDPARRCWSVLRPIMPSPADEAAQMYDAMLADTNMPDMVRTTSKSVVMRILTQRALDSYQTVATNSSVSWRFSAPELDSELAMRFRFTNLFGMRDDVRGHIAGRGFGAAVSNITQAVVTVPLRRFDPALQSAHLADGEVIFFNRGARNVMLRPRKDVELLVRADGFAANVLRAYLQLVGMLALLVAFGVFLGAGLGRPVAVFVVVVTIVLGEMCPSVIEQYPDELERNRTDAIGLMFARSAATLTHPIASLNPLSDLAEDNRVQPGETLRVLLLDAVLLPLALMALAALLVRRRCLD